MAMTTKTAGRTQLSTVEERPADRLLRRPRGDARHGRLHLVGGDPALVQGAVEGPEPRDQSRPDHHLGDRRRDLDAAIAVRHHVGVCAGRVEALLARTA